MRDPALSAAGEQQVQNLHKHLKSTGICDPVQLIVVSPFRRALSTALGAWGLPNATPTSANTTTPLVSGAAAAPKAAADVKAPPFLVTHLQREVMDTWSDVGRSPRDLLEVFPDAPRSLRESVASLPDAWWYYDERKG
jgi:hypothetical protein